MNENERNFWKAFIAFWGGVFIVAAVQMYFVSGG